MSKLQIITTYYKIRVLYRNSKKNEEFNKFFQEYKKENKGKWQSIVNGLEVTEEKLFEKTVGEEEDEAKMMSELTDREKFKGFYNKMSNQKNVNKLSFNYKNKLVGTR